MLTPALAALELLRRRKARTDLHAFIEYIRDDYITSAFSQAVCAALDQFLADLDAGLRPILILRAPPQHGKSDIVSRHLPAYIFGRNPELSVAGLSYAKDLASDMNRDVQRVMMSEEYKRLFPESALNNKRVVTIDVEAKRNSETFELVGHRGRYICAGVGGPLTGKRVDCLVAGTLISTDKGLICIEDLPKHANSCKILSFNGSELTYGHLKAFASRQGFGIYRIRTQSGRVFEATGDHRVFTERGWIEAAKLASGDILVCGVQSSSNTNGGGLSQDVGNGAELRKVLLQEMRGFRNSRQQKNEVRNMWSRVRRKRAQVLLKRLQAQAAKVTSRYKNRLRDVHARFRGDACLGEVPNLLRPNLRRSSACSAHDGERQPTLSRRARATTITAAFRQSLSNHKAARFSARRLRLRAVLKNRLSAGGPSYRRMVEQQCIVEFGYPMRRLSQSSPQADGFQQVRDYVKSVELVRESATVYDIQVAGDHNFFANGVLVHNCGIVDDPIKNAKEALSATVKDSIWNWYQTTFLTRLSKNSGQIIMATSWAMDDLSGRVIANNPRAKVLDFPAINDPNEEGYNAALPLGALVPELHPIEKLRETKASLSAYFWAAMYQQKPKPLGGTVFKDMGLRYYNAYTLPTDFDELICSWDMTFKDSEGSDYVVGQAWGLKGANAYLLDQTRDRMTFTQSKAAVIAMRNKFPNCTHVLIEDKANGPAIMDSLEAVVPGLTPVEPDGSKTARAHAVTAFWEAGNVWLPEDAKWIDEFVEEVTTFPAAANDDQVDAMSQALKHLFIRTGWSFFS